MTRQGTTGILRELGVGAAGLSEREVGDRRKVHGYNEIQEKREPVWKLLLDQFNDMMVYILLAAVAVSVGVPLIHEGALHRDEIVNALVILAIIILNGILGFAQEWRAENAIAMLKKLSSPHVLAR